MEESDSVPQLIDTWHFRVQKIQRSHYDAGSRYHRRHLLLGIPVVVTSAIAGGSLLTSIVSAQLGGIATLIISLLYGLQTFLFYAERSARHKHAAAQYSSVRRAIEELKAHLSDKKTNLRLEITAIRKQLDALAIESPEIPMDILKRHGHSPEKMAALHLSNMK